MLASLLPFAGAIFTMERLPADVWPIISAYLNASVLRHVSQQLRALLAPVYMRQSDWQPAGPVLLSPLAVTVGLRLRVWRAATNSKRERAIQHLTPLRMAPNLRVLQLDLSHCLLGDQVAEALSVLKDAPSLHTLHLDLTHNGITDRGARALAELAQAPSLHTLHLILERCHVGDDGLQAFVKFSEASALQIFHLNLAFNKVASDGALALAALHKAPSLHTLFLNLCGNAVNGAGASGLAQLGLSASLRGLYLNLSLNDIDHRGMAGLAELNKAPALQNLHLVLMFNEARYGMHALVQLKESPALRRLPVNTRGNLFYRKGNPLKVLSRYEWLDVVELGVWMLALGLLLYGAAHCLSGQMVAGLFLMLQMLRPIENVLPEDARGWMNECLMRLPECPKPVKKSWLLLLPQLSEWTCGSTGLYISKFTPLACALWLSFGVVLRAFPLNRARAPEDTSVRPVSTAKLAQKAVRLILVGGVGIVLLVQQPMVTNQVVGSLIWAYAWFYTGIETVEWLEIREIRRQFRPVQRPVLQR